MDLAEGSGNGLCSGLGRAEGRAEGRVCSLLLPRLRSACGLCMTQGSR